MKKIGLTVLFLISLVHFLCADEIFFGPRIGMNIGWFGGGEWRDYIDGKQDDFGIAVAPIPNFGSVLGVGIEDKLSKNFSLAAEFFYTRYGHCYEYSYSHPKVEGGSWFEVLQLPILVKFSVSSGEGYYIYGFLGPSVLMVIGNVESDESEGGISLAPGGAPDKMLLAGSLGGIGTEYPLKRGIISIELRWGRNQILGLEDPDLEFVSNGLQMVLGYGFRLR